ncbi:hypothetical protein RRG08_017819 [Elysia crispata]|uniref:Uncharacterized protein n=1 Tax=Elysia crispata TaxID=231223 RepID=A0AAE1APM1_9GAST|nr:hypothetical protein RRG08_017819 [Elysia crispata]
MQNATVTAKGEETTSHGLRWNNAPTLLSTFICDWFTGCLATRTQNVKLKQVNYSRFFGMSIYNVVTAQQFTEPLDSMLNTPDTSLITSQGTPRPLSRMMMSGLWHLSSQMQLPNCPAVH